MKTLPITDDFNQNLEAVLGHIILQNDTLKHMAAQMAQGFRFEINGCLKLIDSGPELVSVSIRPAPSFPEKHQSSPPQITEADRTMVDALPPDADRYLILMAVAAEMATRSWSHKRMSHVEWLEYMAEAGLAMDRALGGFTDRLYEIGEVFAERVMVSQRMDADELEAVALEVIADQILSDAEDLNN